MSYGRLKIYSDAKEITAANVVDEVNKAYSIHCITHQFVCRFFILINSLLNYLAH